MIARAHARAYFGPDQLLSASASPACRMLVGAHISTRADTACLLCIIPYTSCMCVRTLFPPPQGKSDELEMSTESDIGGLGAS